MECEVPLILRNICDPPKKLYVLGEGKLLDSNKIIAVVGTRKPKETSIKITKLLVEGLVKRGYIIVSGMALGIDAVAHWTAIESGGKTIAVLGAGVDIIYPPENRGLYFKILETGGAIVSEIPNGQRVERAVFAARNRIISGLAQAVVVVEAEIKSGSLITARLALDQGKDIYCVPGSPGTDYLIEQGATSLV